MRVISTLMMMMVDMDVGSLEQDYQNERKET